MSSADEAFDKLLGKNALNIPVANPSTEARGTPSPSVSSIPVANGSESGDMSEAMRVLDLIDENGGDYSPQNYGIDDGDHIFATPTETDLEPVEEDLGNARRQGSRIVGRDADVDYMSETDADVVDEDDDNGSDGDSNTEVDYGVDAELRKARRFRRFSYLPLGDMEYFENRARDVMASLASQEPDRPSLAITSPSRGDGQTEIAIRLALAMAKRVDYRVLLVDFDVRKPQIAPRLGLSSKYFTLFDVLRGSCPLGEALMMSEEDNLYVLPARASDRDGDEVLNDRQVQALMTQIHANFDFTVISCGSADHADAAIVCRHAGATALAAYCRRTKAKALRDAAEKLSESGAQIVGMLLTGA